VIIGPDGRGGPDEGAEENIRRGRDGAAETEREAARRSRVRQTFQKTKAIHATAIASGHHSVRPTMPIQAMNT
jgi:hypothetical protein